MSADPCPRRSLAVLAAAAALLGARCAPPASATAQQAAAAAAADARQGVDRYAPRQTRIGPRFADPALDESSGLVPAAAPGVFWTMNDSGGEPELFAVGAADGRTRGRVRVTGARNVDWEALAAGPCGAAAPPTRRCLYVADVGDNAGARAEVTLYRVPEPGLDAAGRPPAVTAPAEALRVRYADGPHDVEAAAVLPDGAVWLVTKQVRRGAGEALRPALVYRVPAGAWDVPNRMPDDSPDAGPAVAALADSVPVVPDGTFTRKVTDAAFDPARRLLAVRTYDAVYLVPLAGPPWRVDRARRATACDVTVLREPQGEGVAFAPDRPGDRAGAPGAPVALLLSSESNFLAPGGLASLACPGPR